MHGVPKRLILTGASGFIGANLARRLITDGHEVHLLVRPAETRWRLTSIANDVVFHTVALEQNDRLEQIVRTINPEWVFHLAAYGAYPSQTDVRRIIETNYNGTVNLVEACLKTDFEAFVNTGSSSEYGYMDHAPAEFELPNPNSHYAASKAAATLYCRFIAHHHQRQLTTLRLYSAFGPWEEPTRLMPNLILHALRGQLPPLVSPLIARDFVYVADIEDAFLAATDLPASDCGSVFNIGTGIQVTLEQLVRVVGEQFSLDMQPQWGTMPDRKWDTDIWVADPKLAQSTLGWKPSHDLDDGLRAFTAWLTSEPNIREHYERSRTPPQ